MTTDVKKLFNYWHAEADYSWEVARSLWEKKKYPECLFFAHLALEKLLKALIVARTKTHAPPLHGLLRLAQIAGLPLTPEQVKNFTTFSDFYMAGRYDEDKMNFRKKCTREFTQRYLKEMSGYYVWLKKETSQHK